MEKSIIPIEAGQVLEIKSNWLQGKMDEVAKGEAAIRELEKIEGISPSKIARAKGRLRFIRRFVELLQEGFIPIPRMDFELLDVSTFMGRRVYLDKMPVSALATIAEYQHKFDHLGLVRPQSKRRDPILIGIIQYAWHEEHFILNWWRPDLLRQIDLW